MASSRRHEATFFTATILEWKFLLANDNYKDIIIESLRYLVEKEKVQVYAFVIMNNHMHLLWNIIRPAKREDVQRDFLKFTARTIINDLDNNNPELLKEHYVGVKDRKYQVWERNPLSIEIWTEEILRQKLQYIHNNPVRAGLCIYEEEYKYSTARIYQGQPDTWGFITPIYF